jgi:ABC-type glycerol-3-phosphate transport system permease component
MPIISAVERRSWPGRTATALLYLVLTVLGITMVVPFAITVASSFTNDYDYERFHPVPRSLYSLPDRYLKSLVLFCNQYPKWYEQLGAYFPAMPNHWATWRGIGRDDAGTRAFAQAQLAATPEQAARRAAMAADYADFTAGYPLDDTLLTLRDLDAARFLQQRYEGLVDAAAPAGAKPRGRARREAALALLRQTWGTPLTTFYLAGFQRTEQRQPYWQQTWYPAVEAPKYRDFLLVKRAATYHVFTPGVAGDWQRWAARQWPGEAAPSLEELATAGNSIWQERWQEFKRTQAPASPAVPFALRTVWYSYLRSEDVRRQLNALDPAQPLLPAGQEFDHTTWNRLAGTAYASRAELPFPVPADAPPALQQVWQQFVATRYPVRLTRLIITPDLQQRYRESLRTRFKTVAVANQMLGTQAREWTDFTIGETAPQGEAARSLRNLWGDFASSQPPAARVLTSSEFAWQDFLREKYGTLEAVNAAYGTGYARFEEAFPPFAAAYTETFLHRPWALTLQPVLSNYQAIITFLFERGRALLVTVLLIMLAIGATLTINPMAAYALSRFNLSGKDKIILFLLATMAFPAMVSAIPAYLLMRDLNLLNTFFALVLPGAASGMAIFILKGFFDSLPRELYEAATIDGAKEWQIFLIITMPMMKPILAINSLNAFIHAYNGWEWALIICQDQDMWTLSVWMYQANQWWAAEAPWLVMAGFVIVSIPTLLAFLLCQKIIMRGIILPALK